MFRSLCVSGLALLMLMAEVSRGQPCPRSCNCYQTNEVHCTFRSLLTIPAGLPAHTRRINLGFNSINQIPSKSLAGLKKTELLMLHSNNLHHLPDEVFRDMKSLQILKLSYNKLREISSSLTFSGLTSLLRLYLDHNFLQHIHPRALLQLPSLRLLRLQGNRLHQLHPHALCTLSLLNTYYFSTLRHLDLSNNSLITLPKDTVTTAPLLESLVLQDNPWSCDCRMNWFFTWTLSHPDLMKCPGGPQCPVCASPPSLQGHGLLDHTALLCTSATIYSPGKEAHSETDLSEIQSSETFREPLGSVSLGLSDQQGNSVDLSCNVTHSTDSKDIVPPSDLSWTPSSPISLAFSLSVDCPLEGRSYEKLWRILAYYSETAARLEREIMLSKAPTLAYRYRQSAETDGYYHTGVKASVKARPQWLLQPAISIQLNRVQSNRHKVQLIYSTRVSAQPDPTFHLSATFPASPQWVQILTNHTSAGIASVAGSKAELFCPVLSSGKSNIWWILPDGSKIISPSISLDGRIRASTAGLHLQNIRLSDAGIYYCIAHAGKDTDVFPVRLVVEESSVPHTGELVGPAVTGVIRETVSLSCNVSGSPQPHIYWILPDGNVVRKGVAVSGGVIMQSNNSLSILNPSQGDLGHYRCIAVNQYGSDSMSMKLNLNSQHISSFESLFLNEPQSASGRSTEIRASLLGQDNEGSGDEEEQKEQLTTLDRKRFKKPLQPLPKRQNPAKKLNVPQSKGSLRRGGRPVSSFDQRRNRFHNRHRVTTNKQRIDPKQWADLLAKIRQKTTNASSTQIIPTEKPTTKLIQRTENKDKSKTEEIYVDRAQGGGDETEGSSVDDSLLEEQSQPTQPSYTDTQEITEVTTGEVILTYVVGMKEKSAKMNTEKDEQAENTSSPTTKPETENKMVTSNQISGTNEILQVTSEDNKQIANPNQGGTNSQNFQQRLLHNSVPNIQPQSPWNSRRKIGQRRRLNRPRIRPVTPLHPVHEPVGPTTQTVSPILPTVLTSTHRDTLFERKYQITTSSNNVFQKHLIPSVSDNTKMSTSNPVLSSVTPSQVHKDIMTHSVTIPHTEESTFSITPTTDNFSVVLSETRVSDEHEGTHGPQMHTESQTTSGKHPKRPPSKHQEEPERNVMGESLLSTTASFLVSPHSSSPSASPTASKITTSASVIPEREDRVGTTENSSTFMFSENTYPTVSTMRATVSPSSSTASSTSSPTRLSLIDPTSTTTTTKLPPTTLSPTFTAFSIISASEPSTTTVTKSLAGRGTTGTTTNTDSILFHNSPHMSSYSLQTTTRMTPTTPTKILPAGRSSTHSTYSATTTKMTTSSNKHLSSTRQVNHQVKPVSRSPNQIRPPTDWKNSGANSIPDSHSSRPHQPSSSMLPVAPRTPVLRSRPRIVEPHVRTVSYPAESTARLDCEAQGEPKPSITWTKAATGAVMSIYSRAEHFRVFVNGSLVIYNVQLRDKGTYICNAKSFLGYDRSVMTLEVWNRSPRMQLASYREVTVHQGEEVHLACQADGVPKPLLSWVLPDRSTLTSTGTSTNRISMDRNGTLHIPVTSPSDRGTYRCVASNSAGAASSSVRVHVSSLPPVIQQAKEEHLLLSLGAPVFAHCSARGAPPPTLRWRIPDGTFVRLSQFIHGNLFVLPNGTLHIHRVEQKDTGSYECTAINTVGTAKRTLIVEVEGGNNMERQPIKEDIKEKEIPSEKFFSSSSTAKDKASTILSDSQNSTKLSTPYSPDRSRHLLLSPSPSHSSSNSCPEINKAVTASPAFFTNIRKTNPSSKSFPPSVPTNKTKVSHSINNSRVFSSVPVDKKMLSVLQPHHLSPFTKAHIISTSPMTSNVDHGGILLLDCSVTGNPTPNIIWRTPNRKLVDKHYSFDHRMKVHLNGTLSVYPVTEKDGGDYLCIARNKVSDDFQRLHVIVATKPAKIEPKQPLHHVVSFGKTLKVDCQATGLPDPAVRWSLPDGTIVNSVLNGEHRGARMQQLTVFDNGTLLVPAVGVEQEGEYTCYAENQRGQDSMKVKVKIMRTSPPTFINDKTHHVIRVHEGQTASIPCQTPGDSFSTVTWFSPAHRIIPKSLGSGYYSERVVVVSDGILEIRSVQKIDTGNYTCQARNSAGVRTMVVNLEVEGLTLGGSDPVEQRRSWRVGNGRGNSLDIRSGGFKTETTRHGFTNEYINKLNSNHNNSNKLIIGNGRTKGVIANSTINLATEAGKPALRSNSRYGFDRPVNVIPIQAGHTGNSLGPDREPKISIKVDSTVNIVNNHGSNLGVSYRTDATSGGNRNPASNNNEVNGGRTHNYTDTSRGDSRLGDISRNVGSDSSWSYNRAGTNILRGNVFSRNGPVGGTTDTIRRSIDSNATVAVVTTVKKQAIRGQTVHLPCPSNGSPPERLAWLLPGNGMLPAPYYGSRLTVHRNGSLELRGVRTNDGGTLVCVVKSERGETVIRVELEVLELQEKPQSYQRQPSEERLLAGVSNPAHFPNTRPYPPVLHLQRTPSSPITQRPLNSPPAGSVHGPTVSTRTAPLVSTINGETFRLSCLTHQSQGSLSWTLPNGKVLFKGESDDSGHYTVLQDGTLKVEQASVFDRGSYTCKSLSLDSSSVLIVTVPVIVIAYPPRITAGPSPVTYTRNGVAVELPCLTIATPRATVTWETPELTQLRVMSQPRIYGNRYLNPQGSLVIQNPTQRDTGYYRCTAKNVIGVDSKATYLHVM